MKRAATFPPAVVVHGLPHVQLALAEGMPVTLLSGPNAAAYAGCGWWRALMTMAGAADDILDCGDSPGRVLEALSIGCRAMVLRPGPAFADVAERAARTGAIVLAARPPALDLATRGAGRHLAAWLGSANPAPSEKTGDTRHADHASRQNDPGLLRER